VVTPISRVVSEDGAWTIGDGAGRGPVAARLHRLLADVQRGRVADEHDWLDRIPAGGVSSVGPGS
jgi:branched-chain amino acid aminotransferase